MSKIQRTEQETIILYDVELDQWEVYSNYPPHIRKYRDKLDPIHREEFYPDDSEKMIDGVIHGSVSVRGKRKITDKQREAMAERMKELHAQN